MENYQELPPRRACRDKDVVQPDESCNRIPEHSLTSPLTIGIRRNFVSGTFGDISIDR